MKKNEKSKKNYFTRLASLEKKVFKAQKDYSEVIKELANQRKKFDAILTAEAVQASSKGQNVSAALDRLLKAGDEEQGHLIKKKMKLYAAYLRDLREYERMLPYFQFKDLFQLFDVCDFSDCVSSQLTNLSLLRYSAFAYGGLHVELPNQADVEASEPPPTVRIKVWGYATGNSIGNCNGQVWWGLEIDDVGKGIEFFSSSSITGIVNVGICNDVYPAVYLRLGIQVHQYRACQGSLADYDPATWQPYRIWHAFPEEAAYGDSTKSISITTPGLSSIEPFEASVNDKVCDIHAGDKFVFWYSFGAQADCSGVDLSPLDTGYLVLNPPYVLHYEQE
jgi:hypothetical protein